MKKRYLVWFGLMLSMALIGCASEKDLDTSKLEQYEIKQTTDEALSDDFIYRLVTEKGEYKSGENIVIYAELEYIGEKEEITIFHAASPFYFPMEEKLRGFRIDYFMNEPLLQTTLQKGTPFREVYSKSGGYSEQDDPGFVKFMKRFLQGDSFPLGYYVVNGYADFFTEGGNGEGEHAIKLQAQITFKVIK